MTTMDYAMKPIVEADYVTQNVAQDASTHINNTDDMQVLKTEGNDTKFKPTKNRVLHRSPLKLKHLTLPEYCREVQECYFLTITQDVKYGRFAADVQKLNASPIRRRTVERLWRWNVRKYFKEWKITSGLGRTGKSRALLDEALAQVDGYEGFDVDAHWRLQSLTRDIEHLSVDNVAGRNDGTLKPETREQAEKEGMHVLSKKVKERREKKAAMKLRMKLRKEKAKTRKALKRE